MRELAGAARIRSFFHALGERVRKPATVYITGGATAVLYGWRDSTVDIDVKLDPEFDELFRAIAALKEELHINVELASPDMFVPVRDGWADRSPWETTEGQIVVRHFDLYGQALSKIERGHDRDRVDVAALLERGLVDRQKLLAYFTDVEPMLIRYPALDGRRLRQRVEEIAGG